MKFLLVQRFYGLSSAVRPKISNLLWVNKHSKVKLKACVYFLEKLNLCYFTVQVIFLRKVSLLSIFCPQAQGLSQPGMPFCTTRNRTLLPCSDTASLLAASSLHKGLFFSFLAFQHLFLFVLYSEDNVLSSSVKLE